MRLYARCDGMMVGFRVGPLQVFWWRRIPRRLWRIETVNGYHNIGPLELSWGRP
jgi:hypothetical protein